MEPRPFDLNQGSLPDLEKKKEAEGLLSLVGVGAVMNRPKLRDKLTSPSSPPLSHRQACSSQHLEDFWPIAVTKSQNSFPHQGDWKSRSNP